MWQANYKEDYEKNKGRNFTEIPETNEMVLSKELRPVQSKKLYEEKSKEMLKNVSLGAGKHLLENNAVYFAMKVILNPIFVNAKNTSLIHRGPKKSKVYLNR